MTAAERPTEQALEGAAEVRDVWRAPKPHPVKPEWLLAEADDRTVCDQYEPGGSLSCTRSAGHPGRHIATGITILLAAWPGTHAPVEADLTDPQPAPDLADCERRTPGALVLPDGWKRHGDTSLSVYVLGSDDRGYEVSAELDGIDLNWWETRIGTGDARALAARLVEAAGMVEQLRAGAR